MAFPVAATLFDDFSGASGKVATAKPALWSNERINGAGNGLELDGSGELEGPGGTSGMTAPKFGPDVEMYATLGPLPSAGNYIFFAARITPGSNWSGYGIIIIREAGNTFLCQIRKYTNGSNQTPGGWATATTTFEVGDKLGWSVVNNAKGVPVVRLYRFRAGEWKLVVEQTETAVEYLNEGQIGIEFGDNNARLNDLFLGTIGGGLAHTLELTDSISLSDSLARGTGKGLEDVVVLSEAIGQRVGHTEADSLALSDSIGQRVTKNLTDVLGLADSLAKRAMKGIADLLGLSDSVTTGEPDQPAHLAIFDQPSMVLSIDDRPTTELALLDRPTTILTLEDQPA
jgi:hypothetical protein